MNALPATPENSRPSIDAPLVVRIYYDEIADLVQLQPYDVWEYNNLGERYVLAAVDAAGYETLIDQGWTVVVEDTASEHTNPRAKLATEIEDGYRTVDQLYEELIALNTQFADLSEVVTYGQSHCLTQGGCTTLGGDEQPGFPLRAMRITNEVIPGSSVINSETITKGSKPVLFLMANIHSREITTPEIAMRFIEYLLDGYGQDADASWIVDYHEIWVIPTANPDGHWLVELGLMDKYGGSPFYQRKNANNDTDLDGQPDCMVWPPSNDAGMQYGVDLNRNHSFGWGPPYSSDEPCQLTYRGPAAASEVEVAALERLVRALIPDQRGSDLNAPAPKNTMGMFITLHSFSNLVLWPWGNNNAPAPNKPDLMAIGDKLATYNQYLSCQPAECLYPTNGSSDDWAYGELGIPAYTFEIGNTFMPAYDEIDANQWPDNRPALIYAAKIARTPYMSVHGPDMLNLAVNGTAPDLTVTAAVNDRDNGNVAIATAVYSIDEPPWQAGANLKPLAPDDGQLNTAEEMMSADLDLSGLSPGKHILYAQGQDKSGNWGAVSAIFFDVPHTWTFEKIAVGSTVAPGGVIAYLIDFSLNQTGSGHDFSVTLVDNLPPELEVIPETIMANGVPEPELYDSSTRTLHYESTGTFDEEWQLVITFASRVSESIAAGQSLTNQASVAASVNNEVLSITPATAVVRVISPSNYLYFPVLMGPSSTAR